MNFQNFKIALRRISGNLKSNLMIFTGLVLGFTSCFVIYTKVDYEMSFDRSHTHSKDIFRVVRVTSGLEYTNGGLEYRTGVHFPLPAEFKRDIPEIENIVSMLYIYGQKISVPSVQGDKPTVFNLEDGIVFTEPSFFEIFDYGEKIKWISGQGKDALNEPFSIIVTKNIADLLYPHEDPLGKEVSALNLKFKIAGVIQDLPVNSDFPFKVFISLKTFFEVLSPGLQNDWGSLSDNFQCYVALNKNASKSQIEAKFKEVYTPHAYEDYAERRLFKLQPLRNVHKEARFGNYNGRSVSAGLMLALAITGIFIFLIACFNYSNFSIAETSKQNKQFALRMIMGSRPSMLFFQLFTESVIINVFALYTGLVIASEVISRGYTLIDVPYNYFPETNIKLVIFILLLLAAGSFLSVIFSFKNLKASSLSSLLKGEYRVNNNSNKSSFGKVSMIIQFIVAQTVIIASLFILKQMNYINNKDLGYSAENVLIAYLPGNNGSSMSALSNELLSIPGVAGVSFSSISPAKFQQWTSFSFMYNDEQKKLDGEIKFIDTAYLKLYNFRMIAGRNFTSSDSSNAIIVNREFLHEAGFENAVESVGTLINGPQGRVYISGVVEDFNSGSLRNEIRPCVFFNNPGAFRNVSIKLNSTDVSLGMIEKIQEKWKTFYPDEIFQYEFLTEIIAKYYKSDRKAFSLFVLFSIITMFLCILGVLGLSLSMNQKRIKEIGLRRVNGATILQVVYLLNREFLNWILLAFLISIPVSLFFVSRWLQNFAFKTGLSWWVFLFAGIAITGIGLFTVSLQCYSAASTNPVESLKNE